MDGSMSLPMLDAPLDALRNGLGGIAPSSQSAHPVEQLQLQGKGGDATKVQLYRSLYGGAAPAKHSMDCQILNRFERLPGLPSSKFGLEVLTGRLDDLSFDSFLGLPEDSPAQDIDVHSAMEARLHLDTKPLKRAL